MAVSLILVAIGGLSTGLMFRQMKQTAQEIDKLVETLPHARQWESDLRQFRTHLKDYLLDGRHEHLDIVVDMTQRAGASRASDQRSEVIQPPESVDVSVIRVYERFRKQLQSLASGQELGEAGRYVGLRDLVDDVLGPKLIEPARDEVEELEGIARDTSERIQVIARRMAVALTLLSVGGITAGAFAGISIARGISRSIVQLSIPVQDAAGKLNEVVGPFALPSGKDFDDLHHMLESVKREVVVVVDRLQETQREVLRKDQLASMGQLAAGLAHELRNPLMSIKLLVHSIGEQPPTTPQAATDLAILQDEIARLEKLVTTFLDFARPPRLSPRPTNLQEELRRVLELVRVRGEQQAARFSLHVPDAPLTIFADREQVRQVFLNLVLNALDSIRPQGEITIEASANHLSPGHVEVTFSDNGRGLPNDLGEKIFEPFVSTKETGTGLGLAICRRIVEAHGGTLSADSRPDGGAVFRVSLPEIARSPEDIPSSCDPW